MEVNAFIKRTDAAYYCSLIAGEQSKTVRTGAGTLHYLRVANTTNAVRYVHVFDSLAASGVMLLPPIVLAANSERELQTKFAVPFSIGLTLASSTAQTSVTGGGANDLQIHALYE